MAYGKSAVSNGKAEVKLQTPVKDVVGKRKVGGK